MAFALLLLPLNSRSGTDQLLLQFLRSLTALALARRDRGPKLDNMHNHVPCSAAGNGLLGLGLLGNGGSDGCGNFV